MDLFRNIIYLPKQLKILQQNFSKQPMALPNAFDGIYYLTKLLTYYVIRKLWNCVKIKEITLDDAMTRSDDSPRKITVS